LTEQPLSGGNTHASVVRVGDTVRRPTGPWTPAVHAVLRQLEERGVRAAPRVLGVDERDREILEFVEGDVVWPDHYELVASDAALVEVATTIRRLHDALGAVRAPADAAWAELARDPAGRPELLCHNDLAPWNLVRSARGWVFVDWDLCAPGRRGWDVSWSLISFAPLWCETPVEPAEAGRRARLFCDAYGCPFDAALLDTAVERCEREVAQITRRGSAGEAPFDRLLAEGHADAWSRTARNIRERRRLWL
jgi:aminoglycoside phosphotransferase (APT) family kinase protein